MMRDFSYNRRQLMNACLVMLLSPALRLVPGRSAELAGRSAWLAVPSALPILLIYALFLCRFSEKLGTGEAADALVRRCLGEKAGNTALIITALWLLIYCAFILRSGAERMITTVYNDASPGIFVVTMAVLGLTGALSSERTVIRSAKLIVPPVLGVLLIVLAAAIPGVKSENLLPLNSFEVLYSFKGAIVTVDVVVLPMYLTLFLADEKSSPDGHFSSFALWLAEITVLLFVMVLCIVGSFGSSLTAELNQPFFVLVRNLVLFRSLERIEALVVSLWVFSDFILVSLCLSAAQRIIRGCLGKRNNYAGEKMFDMKNGRFIIWLCAAFAAVFALVFAVDSESLTLWSETVIPIANLTFAFVLLPIIYIVGKIRKRI